MFHLRHFTLLFFSLMTFHVMYCHAQHTKSMVLYKQAIKKYSEKSYDEAAALIYKSCQYGISNKDIRSQAIKWHNELGKYDTTLLLIRQVAPEGSPQELAYANGLVEALIKLNQYDKADQICQKISQKNSALQVLCSQASYGRQNKHFLQLDSFAKLSIRINTDRPEMFAVPSYDGQSLYFTRRVRNTDDEIMKANWDTCGDWFSANPIPPPISSYKQESAVSLSFDGHYMFLMRCDEDSHTGWSHGGCDLFMSFTADSIWSTPQAFGGTLNTTGFEGMPCLSPDNKTLIFSSDRPGGYGGKDLWMTRFEMGLWQEPQNLGPHINTPNDDISPFLSSDNKTLFFVSNGHGGFGDFDVLMSQINQNGEWEKPTILPAPINSPYNEISFTTTLDGRYFYLSSDRGNRPKMYDLYSGSLPEAWRPETMVAIKGYLIDSLTDQTLDNGAIIIKDLNDQELYFTRSNRGDGSYTLMVPRNKVVTVTADRHLYYDKIDTIFIDSTISETILFKNMKVLPSDYQPPEKEVVLGMIHFNRNALDILPQYLPFLDSIIDSCKTKPEDDYRIVVTSYTDNSGNPILNEDISTRRAYVIQDYLISKGIPYYNIEATGYGEAMPLVPNDTDEQRDYNRRAEIILREKEWQGIK